MQRFTDLVSRKRPHRHVRGIENANDAKTEEFSRLEATIVTSDIAPRPISRDGQHVQRHAEDLDLLVNELDYDYNVDMGGYPFRSMDSAQELYSGVLYHDLLHNLENFEEETDIECLLIDHTGPKWLNLDEGSMGNLVKNASDRCLNVSALSPTLALEHEARTISNTREALIFFIPLNPSSGGSFKNTIPMTRSNVDQLFTSLLLNPEFLLNMLGRPDYWAPQHRWDVSETNEFLGCDFFCQHPRWNLQVQGAPLSAYSKHDVQRDLTVHIISHKPNDTVVGAIRNLLTSSARHKATEHIANILLESPFDLQVMMSNLNFEASKWHVARYRRLQWSVVNKVDDHLAGLVASDRSRLKELNKTLQIVSQNTDSHLANVEVFLFTARGIYNIALRERAARVKGRGGMMRQRTIDKLEYVIASMEKQRKWFQNYKGRKDSSMQLVFNLVTQQDALNNIELAADMKKDSTSMNAIAALTMVFLPGTFTASVLSAGIFQSEPGMRSFQVTGLWWLWIATTLPITILTVLCWYWYKKEKEKKAAPVMNLGGDEKRYES